jgi:hypothetical protein
LHARELTRRSAPAICPLDGLRGAFARCAIVFHPKSLSPPAFWAFPDARPGARRSSVHGDAIARQSMSLA